MKQDPAVASGVCAPAPLLPIGFQFLLAEQEQENRSEQVSFCVTGSVIQQSKAAKGSVSPAEN